MLQKLLIGLAWIYWHANRPFVAAFTEALLGYGEGDLKVHGRVIVRKLTRYLHELQPQVFMKLVATVALLPLYGPPSYPRSAFWRALVKFWFGLKSLFGHGHFLLSSKSKRAAWIDDMYHELIKNEANEEEDLVKTIVTFTLFKSVLGIAYLDESKVWEAIGYKPFQKRSWNPPSGPDFANPPETESWKLLQAMRKTPREVARKPAGQRTYCVIGSGAGGGVAARTLQEQDPKARVILLESGPLVTNQEFQQTFLEATARLYMNAAATLSLDQQFLFQQGCCVGGSTVVNNSVAFKPRGFWWENLKGRWQALGINLDYDDLLHQYDVLSPLLHVHTLEDRVITIGAHTLREGFEKVDQKQMNFDGIHERLPEPITVPSNTLDCIGCGRCNLGCQYDAKRSLAVTLIPEFVKAGGLLVPDAKVTKLQFQTEASDPDNPYAISAVEVEDANGNKICIEADRFILSSGAYASSKLLWRSGFQGAIPGVRTVGKKFSVNAGAPLVGIFPEAQDPFLGQQIGYAQEIPDERMIIETAFVPPGIMSLGLPAWGPEFQRKLKKARHMMVGVPVFATLAYGEIKKSVMGDSGYGIDFTLIDEDWRRLQKGLEITARAMFAMGAEEVFTNRFDAKSITNPDLVSEHFAGIGPSDFITVQSAHMQGGNVIAPKPYYGVVDKNLKVYGIQNLWICDASVIPSPITINIALTVMALSRYAAMRIAAS
ncbi:MAG TPA: GMC family oxidoreductase N-terminal domain-containing protein [Candidatus Angelobacter sp.]|jgi:choline dehydrogenase-like flavoprotein